MLVNSPSVLSSAGLSSSLRRRQPCILYNRGVYPEESSAKVKKYGLPMLLTQDEGVKSFISNLTSQLSEWLESGKLQRVVVVIMSKATGEVLEVEFQY